MADLVRGAAEDERLELPEDVDRGGIAESGSADADEPSASSSSTTTSHVGAGWSPAPRSPAGVGEARECGQRRPHGRPRPFAAGCGRAATVEIRIALDAAALIERPMHRGWLVRQVKLDPSARASARPLDDRDPHALDALV